MPGQPFRLPADIEYLYFFFRESLLQFMHTDFAQGRKIESGPLPSGDALEPARSGRSGGFFSDNQRLKALPWTGKLYLPEQHEPGGRRSILAAESQQ